jgi:hypothetical protein
VIGEFFVVLAANRGVACCVTTAASIAVEGATCCCVEADASFRARGPQANATAPMHNPVIRKRELIDWKDRRCLSITERAALLTNVRRNELIN